MDTELIKLLHEECSYKIADELLDKFISRTTEIHLKNKEVLVPYGKFDPNVYILKSGIMRYVYFDGERERTYGFGSPGTIMISFHSFCMREPAFFQAEACGKCVVLKLTKVGLDELLKESHEFAIWMFHHATWQLYYKEHKYSVINGHAKERFYAMVKNRPDIIARVPLQAIASYLGVTPSYLSLLKKSFKSKK